MPFFFLFSGYVCVFLKKKKKSRNPSCSAILGQGERAGGRDDAAAAGHRGRTEAAVEERGNPGHAVRLNQTSRLKVPHCATFTSAAVSSGKLFLWFFSDIAANWQPLKQSAAAVGYALGPSNSFYCRFFSHGILVL